MRPDDKLEAIVDDKSVLGLDGIVIYSLTSKTPSLRVKDLRDGLTRKAVNHIKELVDQRPGWQDASPLAFGGGTEFTYGDARELIKEYQEAE